MVRSFDPVERKLPLLFIACEAISGEKRYTELSSGYSFWSFRPTIRANRWLEWATVKVNCLAKDVVISPLRVRDLEEQEMG